MHKLWGLSQYKEVVFTSIEIPMLTHWGRATHICVSKLTIIASDNGLSPGRRQAIIWNNAGILSIGLLGTKFSQILIEILIFSFKKMGLKVSSAKCRPFCLGLNVLKIKWSHDPLICNMGIPIPEKDSFYIETQPWWPPHTPHSHRPILHSLFFTQMFQI